jgi:hypothetical protein
MLVPGDDTGWRRRPGKYPRFIRELETNRELIDVNVYQVGK